MDYLNHQRLVFSKFLGQCDDGMQSNEDLRAFPWQQELLFRSVGAINHLLLATISKLHLF